MINFLDIRNLNKLSKEKNFNISTLAYNIRKRQDYDNENIYVSGCSLKSGFK